MKGTHLTQPNASSSKSLRVELLFVLGSLLIMSLHWATYQLWLQSECFWLKRRGKITFITMRMNAKGCKKQKKTKSWLLLNMYLTLILWGSVDADWCQESFLPVMQLWGLCLPSRLLPLASRRLLQSEVLTFFSLKNVRQLHGERKKSMFTWKKMMES